VLRGLDTVEDDMTAFEDVNVKIKHLRNFHNVLQDPEWTMDGVGEGDEKALLQEFNKVVIAYQRLRPESQEVIADITKNMASGMADYIGRDLRQGTDDEEDFNLYCHYVAGLVGHGLSRLFTASGLEGPEVAEELELADSMGKFLQHTNILRDYLEDYVDGRAFWPKTVWEDYAPDDNLGDFAKDENLDDALGCLNHLIADALELIPDCLAYLQLVKHPDVFKFCAIPQVMAIATLTRCYDNPDCFKGVVKIRKGMAAKMVMDSGDMDAVYTHFHNMMTVIGEKAAKTKNPGHGNKRAQILERVAKSKTLIHELRMQNNAASPAKVLQPIINMVNKFAPVIFLLCMEYLMSKHKTKGFFLRGLDPYELVCVTLSFISVVLMLSFSGMEFALTTKVA
jgi:farnesyl-diphosphate farnesyltransferase